ncbi:MAG: LacI family DNA-binding transcriptional regulator [Lachnospiraceae bacterium]|nr:LacI family DNA-binding transcriptional regulator [Lachnospiraceae bacterium]
MAKGRKAVTMSDIAKRIDVSTVTVSKALSGQKGVSEEVREEIIRLAREMGYKTVHGNVEEKNSSFRIGVLLPPGALATFDSFYWRLYQAVSEMAMEKNCFTGYESLTEEMTGKRILPRLVTDRMVDGLIVIGRPDKKYGDFLKERAGMPLVFLDFYDNSLDVDCFISDSFYGTYLLTEYLLERGHKDIAFVGTLYATESITDRFLGFQKAMMQRGLSIPEDHVIPDRKIEKGTDENFNDFVLPKKMPAAFVCNCDFTAGLLIRKLREKGFRVPEDVSVTGFDNYPTEKELGAAVTTYAVDLQAMAKAAVRSLIKQMNGEKVKKGIHIVEGTLIEKDSVRNRKA